MDERQRNVTVGATTLAGIIGLMALLILFGYLPQWAQNFYFVKVMLPEAAGIYEGSQVKLSGIKIGTVEEIDLQMAPEKGVIVTCAIEEKFRLPEGVRVVVEQAILGGGGTLQFIDDEVPEENVTFLPRDGSALVQGEAASPVGTFAKEMRAVLAGPIAQFSELSESINELSAEWQAVAVNLRELSEPRSTDDVDAGRARGNLATIIARSDARLAELEEVMAGINAYVGDEELRGNIAGAAGNVNEMSSEIVSSIKKLESRYVELADNLAVTLENIDALLATANQPDGTLGKVLLDPSLYDNLNDAAERLNAAFEQLQLLFEKIRDDGLKFEL